MTSLKGVVDPNKQDFHVLIGHDVTQRGSYKRPLSPVL